jgi:hypothetical protein
MPFHFLIVLMITGLPICGLILVFASAVRVRIISN